MADPVQVLVTIHPPEGWDFDWVVQVHEALINQRVTLWQADGFECALAPPQPHGEAKAHRESAAAALDTAEWHQLEAARNAVRIDGQWETRLSERTSRTVQAAALTAIAHALLALGERP